MTIEISKDTRRHLIESIKRYCTENFDEPLGDLKATLLLDFILKEIGPTIYNQGVSDAQAYIQDKVNDIDGSCFEVEFGFWKK